MIWNDLFTVQIPLLEKVLRTVLVYAGLAVLLRFGGKRELAQLNSFDLVVVLLLSNVVQNAVIGNDQSLAGGLLGALVLVTVNSATVRLVNRHPALERLFEGTPTLLVERGQMLRDKIRKLGLREADIAVAAEVAPVDEPAGRSLSPSQEASPPARATTRLTVRPQPHPYPYPPSRRQCADGRGPRTPGRR